MLQSSLKFLKYYDNATLTNLFFLSAHTLARALFPVGFIR